MTRKKGIFSRKEEEEFDQAPGQKEGNEDAGQTAPSESTNVQVVTNDQFLHLKLDRLIDTNLRIAGTLLKVQETCQKTLDLIEKEIQQ